MADRATAWTLTIVMHTECMVDIHAEVQCSMLLNVQDTLRTVWVVDVMSYRGLVEVGLVSRLGRRKDLESLSVCVCVYV